MPPLSEADDALLAAALLASRAAYAPYSGFHVGAAVETEDGRIFTAANVENASYGLSLCAETLAVAAAVSAGARRVIAVAVVGHRAAEPEAPVLATPCGRCRQVIAEFADPSTRIVVRDAMASQTRVFSLGDLLPAAFGPSALADAKV